MSQNDHVLLELCFAEIDQRLNSLGLSKTFAASGKLNEKCYFPLSSFTLKPYQMKVQMKPIILGFPRLLSCGYGINLHLATLIMKCFLFTKQKEWNT